MLGLALPLRRCRIDLLRNYDRRYAEGSVTVPVFNVCLFCMSGLWSSDISVRIVQSGTNCFLNN